MLLNKARCFQDIFRENYYINFKQCWKDSDPRKTQTNLKVNVNMVDLLHQGPYLDLRFLKALQQNKEAIKTGPDWRMVA